MDLDESVLIKMADIINVYWVCLEVEGFTSRRRKNVFDHYYTSLWTQNVSTQPIGNVQHCQPHPKGSCILECTTL